MLAGPAGVGKTRLARRGPRAGRAGRPGHRPGHRHAGDRHGSVRRAGAVAARSAGRPGSRCRRPCRTPPPLGRQPGGAGRHGRLALPASMTPISSTTPRRRSSISWRSTSTASRARHHANRRTGPRPGPGPLEGRAGRAARPRRARPPRPSTSCCQRCSRGRSIRPPPWPTEPCAARATCCSCGSSSSARSMTAPCATKAGSGGWPAGSPVRPAGRAGRGPARRARAQRNGRSSSSSPSVSPSVRAELASLGDPHVGEHLERQGLLVSRTDGHRLELRLAHPLYGEVLRTRIPALRVRALARSLAEAVEETGARRREDTLRVATWRLDGGGGRPELMLAAATTARWRYDFPLAERLARAAVDAGAGFERRLLAAQLASLQGRGEEAEQELAALAQRGDRRRRTGGRRPDPRRQPGLLPGPPGRRSDDRRGGRRTITDPDARDDLRARRAPRSPSLSTVPGREPSSPSPSWTGPGAGPSSGRPWSPPSRSAGSAGSRPPSRPPIGAMPPTSPSTSRSTGIRGSTSSSAARRWPAAGVWTRPSRWPAPSYEQALAERSDEGQAWFAWHLVSVVGDRGHVRAAIRYAREAVALFRKLGRPQYMSFCLIVPGHRPGGGLVTPKRRRRRSSNSTTWASATCSWGSIPSRRGPGWRRRPGICGPPSGSWSRPRPRARRSVISPVGRRRCTASPDSVGPRTWSTV